MEIGPCLPPHLLKKTNKDSESSAVNEETVQIGPSLPPNLKIHESSLVEDSNKEKDDDDDAYGPALPPHLAKASKPRGSIGPALPQGPSKEDENSDEEIGPVIGPMPSYSSSDQYYSSIEKDIEARSKAMKDKLTGKNKVKQKREEWMTELPPEIGKNFGLGPRKFRKQAVDCGDRSVWTDTPSDRNKKQEERESRKRAAEDTKAPWEEEKEKNTNQLIASYTKQHRGESLMEMHQRELSKKRKEEGLKPNERRPFDRDKDLGHTTIDPAKRKSIVNKSKELETRFHRSKSGSTFL